MSTKSGLKCNRKSSCRIGCKVLCWQHARQVGMFLQKGTLCTKHVLEELEVVRRPFKGLGKSFYGISGSLTVNSMHKIFNAMYDKNSTFVDIGAADGYIVILALLYGYTSSAGIEFDEGDALRHIYSSIWQTTLNKYPMLLKQSWSPKKPIMYYDTGIEDISSMDSFGANVHIFSFWDGFSEHDSRILLERLKTSKNVTQVCLVRRRSRTWGTFKKVQKYLETIKETVSIEVVYGKEKYLATIFQLRHHL